MTLKKLTEENIGELSGKQICLYEKTISYLEELCSQYNILESISCIVDTNQRNLGKFTFKNRMLDVYDLHHLLRIPLEQTVIVITSDYYKEAFDKIADVLVVDHPDMDVYYFANQETEYEESYRKY